MKNKVFLLNYSGHDISSLEQYGDIIFLTEGNIRIFEMDRNNYHIAASLKANKFDSANDYIALSGNLIVGFNLGIAIGNKYPKAILKMLLWDAKIRQYTLVHFNTKPKLFREGASKCNVTI